MKKLYKYDGPIYLWESIYARRVYYVHASSAKSAVSTLNFKQIRDEFKRTDLRAKLKYIKEEK